MTPAPPRAGPGARPREPARLCRDRVPSAPRGPLGASLARGRAASGSRGDRHRRGQRLGVRPGRCAGPRILALVDVARGRFPRLGRGSIEGWQPLRRDRSSRPLLVHFAAGELLAGEGRLREAIEALRLAERFQALLATRHVLTGPRAGSIALIQLRLGDAGERTRRRLAAPATTSVRRGAVTAAALALAEGRAPGRDRCCCPRDRGADPVVRVGTMIQALVLRAIARDRLGDAGEPRQTSSGPSTSPSPTGSSCRS